MRLAIHEVRPDEDHGRARRVDQQDQARNIAVDSVSRQERPEQVRDEIQPSSATEKGFTSQLVPNRHAIPRQCSLTCPRAPRSILSSIGIIISQNSTATGRLTSTIVEPPMRGKRQARPDQRRRRHDAERDPERQVPLSKTPIAGAFPIAGLPARVVASSHDARLPMAFQTGSVA
jgi:hypothetical protein